jgi:hypothetical protein
LRERSIPAYENQDAAGDGYLPGLRPLLRFPIAEDLRRRSPGARRPGRSGSGPGLIWEWRRGAWVRYSWARLLLDEFIAVWYGVMITLVAAGAWVFYLYL